MVAFSSGLVDSAERGGTSAPSLIHQTETTPSGYDLLVKRHGL